MKVPFLYSTHSKPFHAKLWLKTMKKGSKIEKNQLQIFKVNKKRTSNIDYHELTKKFADPDFKKKVAKYAKIGLDHVYKTVSDLVI
jgi:hypothetical protein